MMLLSHVPDLADCPQDMLTFQEEFVSRFECDTHQPHANETAAVAQTVSLVEGKVKVIQTHKQPPPQKKKNRFPYFW